MIRFPAKSLDSLLDSAVIPRYMQSKCTCEFQVLIPLHLIKDIAIMAKPFA